MTRYPHDHPIWTVLKHTVYLGFITLILYLNASNFDETELKTLGEIVVGVLAYQGVVAAKAKITKKEQ